MWFVKKLFRGPKNATFISFPKDCDISSTWYFLGGLTGGPKFSMWNMLYVVRLRQGQLSSTDWLRQEVTLSRDF